MYLADTGEVSLGKIGDDGWPATAALPPSFEPTAFHRLEMAVRGDQLEIALDGKRLMLQQDGKRRSYALLPGIRSGEAGLVFGPAGNDGGQRVRNLVVSEHHSLNDLPLHSYLESQSADASR